MKVNTYLSEILRGEWALNIEQIQNYYPIMLAALEGKSFGFHQLGRENEPKSILSFVDPISKSRLSDQEALKSDAVAVISMHGEVMKYGDDCVYGADEIVEALQIANNMKSVAAIILDVDGPGGSVSAIGPFLEFKKQKPIVALVDQAASLHYWTTVLLADHIMARNNVTSKVGSIGVFSTFIDNTEEMAKRGIKVNHIYSDHSPHKNEAFKLALEGKFEMIKTEMLNPTAVEFQNAVRKNRPNLVEEVGVLTGKMFGTEKALKFGMIDSVGTMEQAILKAIML